MLIPIRIAIGGGGGPYTRAMFELTVRREFCAAHAIRIAGDLEPLHGHNWRVTVTVRSDDVNDDGLVCDFHELERVVDATLAAWKNANLNDAPQFADKNPSAEHVAQEIARAVASAAPRGARVHRVAVTEAPGCEAAYYPAVSGA